MKRDIKEDILNKKYSQLDNKAILITYDFEKVTYALPVNSSPELRMHFIAAILKYHNSSEDFEEIIEQLNTNNFDDDTQISQNEVICYNIVYSVGFMANVLIELQQQLALNKAEISLGENCYFLAMIRLKASFKSSIILLNNGFFVESIPIFRLIYEQLCWACFVIDETSGDNIKKNSITKNTKHLKNKIGEKYGKLYDFLSKEAHLSASTIGKYIISDEKNSSIKVLDSSGKKAAEEVETLLLLFRMFIEVFGCGINHFTLNQEDQRHYCEILELQRTSVSMLFEAYKENIIIKFDKKI